MGCIFLFVILLLKNSNPDTKIRWWQTEVYNRADGLNLDVPSLQHLPAPRPFTELLSCPENFIYITFMYIISVKFHEYPTAMHSYICFIQIQKLGPKEG